MLLPNTFKAYMHPEVEGSYLQYWQSLERAEEGRDSVRVGIRQGLEGGGSGKKFALLTLPKGVRGALLVP